TFEGDDPMLRRIRAELREACLAAAEAALAVGRPDEAVSWLSEFVDREPFDEPALAADDRPADALGRYDRLRRALADELGVHPGSAVQAAYLAVLAADGPSE